MRHVGRFVTEYLSHRHTPIRRWDSLLFLLFEVVKMGGGGVSTQYHTLLALYKKGILHVARRMVLRDIEHIKIVVFTLNEGPILKSKTHLIENGICLPYEVS